MVNRTQRRKIERQTGEKPPVNLIEWRSSDAVARRKEVWEVVWRIVRLNELQKRRNRPLARFQRFMNRVFRVKQPQLDPKTGEMTE